MYQEMSIVFNVLMESPITDIFEMHISYCKLWPFVIILEERTEYNLTSPSLSYTVSTTTSFVMIWNNLSFCYTS